jgi:hypothetical protein
MYKLLLKDDDDDYSKWLLSLPATDRRTAEMDMYKPEEYPAVVVWSVSDIAVASWLLLWFM